MDALKSKLSFVNKLPTFILSLLNVSVILLLLSFGVIHSSFANVTNGHVIPGDFSASGGTARYIVPITIPPGMAEMQPSINLNYSSQFGNGLVGKGWSIGGLSVISRCAQSMSINGKIQGVAFNYGDVFCLDGVQLIPIRGANGAHLSEYRTHVDSFHKIILHDADGVNGPDYFEVYTKKSGQKKIYGNAGGRLDAQIEAQASTVVHMWPLSHVEDVAGNYVTYRFINDKVNGFTAIDRIDYTGNVAAGLTPSASVKFIYKNSAQLGGFHSQFGYQAGSKMNVVLRLSNIKTFVGNINSVQKTVLDYSLIYGFNNATVNGDASQLQSIQLFSYDANTNQMSDATSKTLFTWSQGPSAQDGSAGNFAVNNVFNLTNTNFGHSDNTKGNLTGDFNGDGITDILSWDNAPLNNKLHLANGDGSFTTAANFNITNTNLSHSNNTFSSVINDFNSDGFADILRLSNTATNNKLYLSNGDGSFRIFAGFNITNAILSHSNGSFRSFFGDYNGDGRVDILRTGNAASQNQLYLGKGDGSFLLSSVFNLTSVNLTHSNRTQGIYTGEFNGDGLTDLLYWNDNPANNKVYLSSGNGTFTVSKNFTLTNIMLGKSDGKYGVMSGDFNGDGVTDLVRWESFSQIASAREGSRLFFSKGNGDFAEELNFKLKNKDFVWTKAPSMFGDFNGDGLTDILFPSRNIATGSNNLYLSDGDGNFIFSLGFLNSFGKIPMVNKKGTTLSDFNGDGRTDILRWSDIASENQLYTSTDIYSRITKIVIEHSGAATTINYKPLTDSKVYTKYTDAVTANGIMDLQIPSYVVSSYTTLDGIGGTKTYSYHYEGLKSHPSYGSLGYRKITMTDSATGFANDRYMLQGLPNLTNDYPIIGQLDYDITRQATKKISVTRNNWRVLSTFNNTVKKMQMVSSSSQSFELNTGQLVNAVTSTTQYVNDNDPRVITVTNSDGYKSITTNNYQPFYLSKWAMTYSRLMAATVQQTTPSITAGRIKSSSFAYAATTGLLNREIIEPGNVNLTVITDTMYDVYGNKETITTSGDPRAIYPIVSRTTSSRYVPGTAGTFAPQIVTTNSLGHTETKTYETRFGKVTKLVGANGVATTWVYDSFGRIQKELHADTSRIDFSTLSYSTKNTSFVPPYSSYYNSSQYDSVKGATNIYYDRLGREILRASNGFKGEIICQDTQYDANGNVFKKSLPYKSSATTTWDFESCLIYDASHQYQTMFYDDLGRVVKTIYPDGRIDTASYNGFTTSNTKDINGKNQRSTKIKNSQNKILQVTDNANANIFYSYDEHANLTKVTDNQGNITTMSYNLRGFKTSMSDPDMGVWKYEYNTLGELVKQTDAKLQVTLSSYDTLGRPLTRTEPKVGGGTTTSTWNYDTAANGIGKLASVGDTNGYNKTVAYDAISREISTTIRSNGHNDIIEKAYFSQSSLVSRVMYPRLRQGRQVQQQNQYDSYGNISNVYVANKLIWTVNTVNAKGQITSELYGNGLSNIRRYYPNSGLLQDSTTGIGNGSTIQNLYYAFDTLGNLTLRSDRNLGVTETSSYDAMNRLSGISVSGQGRAGGTVVGYSKTYAYDSIGNIKTKSDVGSYLYGQNNQGPHQVTTAGNDTFIYDKNGNMTSGKGRILTYTAFNKPNTISTKNTLSVYEYGPSYNRIQKITSTAKNQGAAKQTTTYYIGKSIERLSFSNSNVIEQKLYIPIGNVTYVYSESNNTATAKSRYMHKDHLGSIDAITTELGVLEEQNSFNAWGKRRNDNWSIPSLVQQVALTSQTTRGFTGHEMEDDIGLINMNARMYDAVLGRFLQADTFIQFAYSTQGFNRYTYVNNNPLSFTDPSGNFLSGLVRGIINRVVRAAVRFVKQVVAVHEALWKGFTGAINNAVKESPLLQQIGSIAAGIYGGPAGYAAFQAYMTYLNGGSLTDIVRAAAINYISGVASGYIGDGLAAKSINGFQAVFAHGLVGGATAQALGGDFQDGFIGAAVGKIVTLGTPQVSGKASQFAMTVMSGGVAAELGGGKFEDGARSAAMGWMFNEYAHSTTQEGEGFPNEDEEQFAERQAAARAKIAEYDRILSSDPSSPSAAGSIIAYAATTVGGLLLGASVTVTAPVWVPVVGAGLLIGGSAAIIIDSIGGTGNQINYRRNQVYKMQKPLRDLEQRANDSMKKLNNM